MDIVIGAAFGDEGKGLITHYLSSRHGQDATVVRFNGGAQAGHTVMTNCAQRHVFRHVGSGTFAGAKTFLSRFFVTNPILFLEEINELHLLNLNPQIYIDPDSLITTPYDMIINQMSEELRGSKRHGSCGVGFAETIERNLHTEFSFTTANLEDTQKIIDTLHLIRRKWLPKRLQALDIKAIPKHWKDAIASDDIFEFYIHQLSLFLNSVVIERIDFTRSSNPIIFEGAQGLMLDQELGWFPHVTRSYTGLKNILQLIKDAGNQKLNVHYVTRSYLTRHGSGPLPHELLTLPYNKIIDKTNITNTYQGALRYAWFNLDLIKTFIKSDLSTVPKGIKVNHQLAVTCLDQVDEQITFINDKKICQELQDDFLQKLSKEIEVPSMLCSYGPTIETIKQWQQ